MSLSFSRALACAVPLLDLLRKLLLKLSQLSLPRFDLQGRCQATTRHLSLRAQDLKCPDSRGSPPKYMVGFMLRLMQASIPLATSGGNLATISYPGHSAVSLCETSATMAGARGCPGFSAHRCQPSHDWVISRPRQGSPSPFCHVAAVAVLH